MDNFEPVKQYRQTKHILITQEAAAMTFNLSIPKE